MVTRFARAVVRLRYVIVAFWTCAAFGAAFFLPTIREAQVDSLGDLVPNEAAAIDAERRASELFGFPLLSRTVIVQRDPDGLSLAAQRDVIARVVSLNRKELPGLTGIAGAYAAVNSFGKPPFSKERSTTAISYLFFPPDIGQGGRRSLAQRLIERHIAEPADGTVGITGAVPARVAQADAILAALPLVELVTAALVALAMALHFRALGAPLVNLFAVGIAYLVSIRLVAYVGSRIGVSVPSEVEPVIVVLLFGVVTDYSIFFFSRFRHRMAAGDDRREGAERTTAELLPIITTAGLTIIGGSAALVIAELGFLQAFGPGMALSVAVGLLVSITFVPAFLAIAGPRLFWPGRSRRVDERAELEPEDPPENAPASRRRARRRPLGAGRAIEVATGRPILTAAGCALVLALAATGLSKLEPANPLIRGLPDDAPAKQAYLEAGEGFAAGILSPTVVIVEGPGLVTDQGSLARLQRLLERQPGVARVFGPANRPGGRPFGAVLSRTGDAARYLVVLDPDPLGGAAIRHLEQLRERMPGLLAAAGLDGAGASFAGDTALVQETVEGTFDDLARVAPVTVLVVFLVLVVFMRALVAPLYLVASSALALAASLGLTIYVFQELLGYGELTYYVPFAAAVLLLSLGSDYNVFLVGRIWGQAEQRGIREAVLAGGASAARPIAVAGLILAASFALLALVPIRSFRELAFAMSLGLLIDAFLVRTLLVPALMSLLGGWSAWPSKRLFAARADRPAEGLFGKSEAFEELDASSRALLELSFKRDVDDREIGELLGEGPEDVARRRAAALDRLAQSLGESDGPGRASLEAELFRHYEDDRRRGEGRGELRRDPHRTATFVTKGGRVAEV